MVTIDSYYDHYCMWWWLHNTISLTSWMNVKWLITWGWLHDLYRLMMNKTTSFSPHWLSDPTFSWVDRRSAWWQASCTLHCMWLRLCLSNMGKRALQSHATGEKHQKALAPNGDCKKSTEYTPFFLLKSPQSNPCSWHCFGSRGDSRCCHTRSPCAPTPSPYSSSNRQPAPPMVQKSSVSWKSVLKMSFVQRLKEHKGVVVPLLRKQLHMHAKTRHDVLS